jgi:hypothetical protein
MSEDGCVNYEKDDLKESIEVSTHRIPLAHFDYRFIDLLDTKVEAICNGERVVGSLWFAGINPLHGQYQVTLDRTPLWPVDPDTIKPYVERMRIHEL